MEDALLAGISSVVGALCGVASGAAGVYAASSIVKRTAQSQETVKDNVATVLTGSLVIALAGAALLIELLDPEFAWACGMGAAVVIGIMTTAFLVAVVVEEEAAAALEWLRSAAGSIKGIGWLLLPLIDKLECDLGIVSEANQQCGPNAK